MDGWKRKEKRELLLIKIPYIEQRNDNWNPDATILSLSLSQLADWTAKSDNRNSLLHGKVIPTVIEAWNDNSRVIYINERADHVWRVTYQFHLIDACHNSVN